MSYGSTFVPFEPHAKISARHTRVRREPSDRQSRVVQYEKEFDVNLSRLDDPPPSKASIRDSMLAYSKKMKSLHEARHTSSSGNGGSGDKLFVRAKHIPKYPTREPKKRRPMSFDELLGRDRDVNDTRPHGAKQRPLSDKVKPVKDSGKKSETELRLPLLSERLKKSGPIQVSLVSASDLYELVDFSLKTKGTKSDSVRLVRMEQETQDNMSRGYRYGRLAGNKMTDDRLPAEDAYNKFERTTDNYQQDYLRRDRYPFYNEQNNTNVPNFEFYEQTFAIDPMVDISPRQERHMNSNVRLPSLSPSEPIRRRPNRAKRMRLVDSMLGDIPEDGMLPMRDNPYDIDYHSRRVISPPPRSNNQSDVNRHTLDSIEEAAETGQLINNTRRQNESSNQESCQQIKSEQTRTEPGATGEDTSGDYRSILPSLDDVKSTKKILIRDDGDVRIEVTQCPPKQAALNTKQKAQKRFKKLIYLRDSAR